MVFASCLAVSRSAPWFRWLVCKDLVAKTVPRLPLSNSSCSGRTMATASRESAEEVVIGLIGAGGNTKKMHIPKLLGIPGVTIKTVCNRSIESSEKVAAEFGIPQVTTNWHDIMSDASINAVVIGTWPYMHAILTREALQAGKHVLTEARMAMNGSEARQMSEAALQRPHLVAQIVPSPFTLPYDATIKQIIASNTLGKLLYIEVKGASSSFADDVGSPLEWRHDIKYSGCNIMFMGIFYEALQRWVGGAKSVFASGRVCVTPRTDGNGDPVTVQIPDHVDIIAGMWCGAQAHFVFSAVTGGHRGPCKEYWIYGSEATLHLDIDANKLEMARKDEGAVWKEVEIRAELRGGWRVEQEFIGAICKQEAVKLTDFSSGMQYMEFTEAVWRSMQQRTVVSLPLL